MHYIVYFILGLDEIFIKLIFKSVLLSSKEITSTVTKTYTNEANIKLFTEIIMLSITTKMLTITTENSTA